MKTSGGVVNGQTLPPILAATGIHWGVVAGQVFGDGRSNGKTFSFHTFQKSKMAAGGHLRYAEVANTLHLVG